MARIRNIFIHFFSGRFHRFFRVVRINLRGNFYGRVTHQNLSHIDRDTGVLEIRAKRMP